MALLQNTQPDTDEIMELHIPVHPLPDEIQMMSRDETVCRYCGVSYLILHAFKKMEEKVKQMEEELELYRGSMKREKKLQDELASLNKCLEQSKVDSDAKAERIKNISVQLENKEEEVRKWSEELCFVQSQLKHSSSLLEQFRARCKQYQQNLKETMSFIQFTKKQTTTLKREVASISDIWATLCQRVLSQIQAANAASQSEIAVLTEALKISQKDMLDLQHQIENQQLLLNRAELNNQQLHALSQRETELQNRCQELQTLTEDLQNQLEIANQNMKKTVSEMQYCKNVIQEKIEESENLQKKIEKLQSEKWEVESRLSGALQEKEEAWLTCEQRCRQMQDELLEKMRRDEETKQKTLYFEHEIDMLKKASSEADQEITALKQERELQLVAHQNRMEQLQDSFKMKMEDNNHWRAKAEAELEKERNQHFAELQETVKNIKEETRTELDTERKKYEELLKKYKREQEALQSKIPSFINDATKNLQTEINTLEVKLKETLSKLVEKEESKEKEIQSLKIIINDLECRLRNEQDNNDVLTEELRRDVSRKTAKLKELSQQREQLTEQLNQSQEENSLLQETVRRECEERFELTEALSQAREQLLELKRLTGGLSVPKRSFSPSSLTSSSVSSCTHKQRLASPKSFGGARLSGLLSLPRTADMPLNDHRGNTDNVGLNTIPLPHPPKARVSPGTEVKQRISAVLRRK